MVTRNAITIRRRLVQFTGVAAVAVAALALSPPGRDVLFHLSPIKWTGEAPRLADLLKLTPGMPGKVVADIGAGDGAMALEIAATLGPSGRMFITERTAEQRARLLDRTRALPDAVVIEALDDRPNLPDACCDAIYMRFGWHHLNNPEAYARSLVQALRRGTARDHYFSPGAFFKWKRPWRQRTRIAVRRPPVRVERRDDRG